jgi:hypothetical protein
VNLELLEEQVLDYLGQTTNPLVSVPTLCAHLQESEEFRILGETRLVEFLQKHERCRLMDSPISPGAVALAESLGEESLSRGPYAILDSRVPTMDQVSLMMAQQLETLKDALAKALGQARERDDQATADQLLNALSRTEKIQQGLSSAAEQKED